MATAKWGEAITVFGTTKCKVVAEKVVAPNTGRISWRVKGTYKGEMIELCGESDLPTAMEHWRRFVEMKFAPSRRKS